MQYDLATSSNLAEGRCIHVDHRRVPQVRTSASVPCDGAPQEQSRRRDKHGRTAPTSSGKGRTESPHPDAAFVTERFSWKSKETAGAEDVAARMEPLALWGGSEVFGKLGPRARSLRVQSHPHGAGDVCVAAMEPAKLRACVKKRKRRESGESRWVGGNGCTHTAPRDSAGRRTLC